MFGVNKEKQVSNGFGMLKISQMTKGNTSIYTKISNPLQITMEIRFGILFINKIASLVNTKICVNNKEFFIELLVDSIPVSQRIFLNSIKILLNNRFGQILGRKIINFILMFHSTIEKYCLILREYKTYYLFIVF